ncbi:hypothetical protein AAVH_37874 [Aphelenchoides avenae]|nr:hypothetical protein AAVH_37874 [Aphelenchus avenae]
MHTEGCSWCSYTHPDTNQYMTVFSFYRDLPPHANTTERTEEPEASQLVRFYTNLPTLNDKDYALQATLRWPSNFFFFWENFGTHYTVLHIRLIDRCHPVSPREFMLQLMLRIRDWPHLRHVQIELIHPGETQPGDSVSVPNQATEFAVETYVRCQAIRSALQDQQPPLPSEFSVTAELDCWYASADVVQQVVANIRRMLEGPQRQVTIEQRSDTSYVITTEWTGHNYQLTLRVPVRSLSVGRTLPPPPLDTEAKRVLALRTRLEEIRKASANDA